jgi:alpha-methylacyl-CoA racemase
VTAGFGGRAPRVLEIGNGLPVWYAGRLLQGMGAEVRRVEPPGGITVTEADLGGHRVLNGRKGVFEANLRNEEGRASLLDELRSTDVLLLSVRPARAVQWGLDPPSLAHLPLVHAWLNAFGQAGPFADLAAHDINASAVSGVAWIEGMQERHGAEQLRTPISDIASSLFLVIAVLDAWAERAAGAQGLLQREVSMADAGLAVLAAWAPDTLRGDLAALAPSPFYATYATRDGVSVAMGALEAWQQSAILELTAAPEPADEGATSVAIAAAVASMDADDLYAFARAHSVGVTPVLHPSEVLDHPHMGARMASAADPGDPWKRVLDPGIGGGGDGVVRDAQQLRGLLFTGGDS